MARRMIFSKEARRKCEIRGRSRSLAQSAAGPAAERKPAAFPAIILEPAATSETGHNPALVGKQTGR
jgi:hypothetical protein